MEGNFQKSWSVYGYNRIDNEFRNNNFNRARPMFHSGRSTKTNLQQRFGQSANQNSPQTKHLTDENDSQFYIRPQKHPEIHPGLRFRSLTDSNIRRFEVNGVTRSCNELQSPPPKFPRMQTFRQLPERIAPILNNIQNTVSQAGPKTEKFLHKGGKKVQKALQGVRTSINTFSQRFKKTTRRRYELENTPTRSPSRAARLTPGKLYSPFDVNTPRTPHSYMKGPKRLQHGYPRRSMMGNENFGLCRTPPPLPPPRPHPVGFDNWLKFNSPSNAFPKDERNRYRLDQAFPPMHPQGPQMHPQDAQMHHPGPQGPEMHPQDPQMHNPGPQGPQMHPQGPQMHHSGPQVHPPSPQMHRPGLLMHPPSPLMHHPGQHGPLMHPQSPQMHHLGPQIHHPGPSMPHVGSPMHHSGPQMHSPCPKMHHPGSPMHRAGPPLHQRTPSMHHPPHQPRY